MSEKNLRRENIVDEIINLTSILMSSRKIGTPSQEKFDRSLIRYNSDKKLKYKIFWKKRYYLLKIKSILEKNRMNSFSKILIKILKNIFLIGEFMCGIFGILSNEDDIKLNALKRGLLKQK